MAVIIYVSESATPTVRGKITAKTHPPCPLAAARGCVMPADPVGHGGCRLCRLAGHRIGQYAHFQQCARLVILALILGDLISYRNSGKGCTRALIGSNEP
jgi:hypothetical protein